MSEKPEEKPAALTPDMARAAIELIDRSTFHGHGEVQAYLHIRAVLQGIASKG